MVCYPALAAEPCRSCTLLALINNALSLGFEAIYALVERNLPLSHIVAEVLPQRIEISEGRVAFVSHKQPFPFRIDGGIVAVVLRRRRRGRH